ncbi:phage tail tape measure protein [uncultured Desulfuromusa sp.]|uniref:phage tail tape measure protein n=1 Tax=uncultured Desulfuromusa sp. TaxID=219183 RepID=UPI002AA941E3|nr:phage tail tape measure protein [uncultured Desulfuromusa sp.]
MDKSLALGVVIGGTLSATVGSAFKTLEQKARASEKQLKQIKIGSSLVDDVSKYRSELLKLQAAKKDGLHSADEMNVKIGATMKKYQQAATKAKEYGIDIGRLAREQQRLTKEMNLANRAVDRQQKLVRNKNIRGQMRGQMVGAVGSIYAMGAGLGGALDYDRAKTRLGTMVSDADLEAANKQVLEFSRHKLGDQTDLLNINYALNSAGLDAATSRAGTEIVAKVAKVTNGAAEGVGEVVGVVFNNMADSLAGSATEKIGRIGDVLTKTQLKYQLRDFNQLGESFKQGAKGAIKYNVDLEQTAAVLGQFNSAGLQGGTAGTAFNAMLRQMTTAADEFGFSMERNADGSLNLIDTLGNLEESMAMFDDPDEKADALQKAFGDEGSGVALLLNNLKKLKAGYQEVRDESAGVVDEKYQKFLDSYSGQVDLAGQQTRGLAIALGSALLPGVNAVLQPIGSVVNGVAEMTEKFPGTTKVIVGATAGIVLLNAAMIGGRYALTFFSDGIQITKGVFDFFRSGTAKTNLLLAAQKVQLIGAAVAQKAAAVGTGILTAAQWAWNVALTANPIGLIVAGVGALIAGGIALYKNWEPFQVLIDTIWDKVTSVGGFIGKLFGFGSSKGAEVGAAVAAGRMRSDSPASSRSVLPRVSPASRSNVIHSNPKIEIHQAPGQSAEDVAAVVQRELMASEQRLAAQQRGRLYD